MRERTAREDLSVSRAPSARRKTVTATAWLAVLLLAATLATGCGGRAPTGVPAVVASTDVGGSVARAVAGTHITVASLLSGTDQDPHSYQASPSDAAALTDAALVVYNGGGYDPWVDKVLAGHPNVKRIDAYSFATREATPDSARGRPANEHVFYDLRVAKAVASAIADRLAAIDSANADSYRANASAFGRDADDIAASEHAIATTYSGVGVIVTEPVAHYLVEATGLVDRTPATLTAATENETDPSPADMAAVLDLINARQVAAVLFNPQTITPAISGVRDAARRAGVPVTDVTETLPAGKDYLSWQRDTVGRLLAALKSHGPGGSSGSARP